MTLTSLWIRLSRMFRPDSTSLCCSYTTGACPSQCLDFFQVRFEAAGAFGAGRPDGWSFDNFLYKESRVKAMAATAETKQAQSALVNLRHAGPPDTEKFGPLASWTSDHGRA